MKRKALGKGIEAIISDRSSITAKGNVIEIDIDSIYPNPYQPRKKFNKEKITELANSIKESGMIQPVVVFKENKKYYLCVGERRWRAAQYLKWKKIDAIVRDLPKGEMLVGALVENIQREDLNAIEIAEGIEMLMELKGLSQEKIGEKLGMSRSTVTNYLRLLKLPEAVKQGVVTGDITQGHARALLSLNNKDDVLFNFSKILTDKLSVRQTEQLIKKIAMRKNITEAVYDPDINKMEKKLIKLFSTKVKLKYSKKGNGRIEIYFSDVDEFERIYKILLKE